MPLVPALCTQCGASLEVDSSQEAAICPHCKTPFITEKAINNYNTTNVTNIGTLNADTVNIVDSNSAENVLKAGETFLHLSDYKSARLKFEEMCERFPYDERGWYGLLKSMTANFATAQITIEFHAKLIDIFEKYCVVSIDNADNSNLKNCRNFIARVGEMVYEQQIRNIDSEISEDERLVEMLKKEIDKSADKLPMPSGGVDAVLEKVRLGKKLSPMEHQVHIRYKIGCTEYMIWYKRKELQPKIEALKTNNDKLERITAKYIK